LVGFLSPTPSKFRNQFSYILCGSMCERFPVILVHFLNFFAKSCCILSNGHTGTVSFVLLNWSVTTLLRIYCTHCFWPKKLSGMTKLWPRLSIYSNNIFLNVQSESKYYTLQSKKLIYFSHFLTFQCTFYFFVLSPPDQPLKILKQCFLFFASKFEEFLENFMNLRLVVAKISRVYGIKSLLAI